MRVLLIGGPGDGQDYVVRPGTPYIEIAEMLPLEVSFKEPAKFDLEPPKTHAYRIWELYGHALGVHDDLTIPEAIGRLMTRYQA